MLKKKIGLIFILSMLTIGCSSSDNKKSTVKNKLPQKENKSEKKVDRFETDSNSDFRSASWGISPQDVMKIEIDKDIFDIPDINGIGFYEEILGFNALVLYQFENNKLIKGSYVASGKDITEEKFNKIKERLYKKYGEFKVTNNLSNRIMETRNNKTLVRYYTDFEYSDIKLEYFEINYYNQQNKTEESLDKLF
jgi:hypothetical protein